MFAVRLLPDVIVVLLLLHVVVEFVAKHTDVALVLGLLPLSLLCLRMTNSHFVVFELNCHGFLDPVGILSKTVALFESHLLQHLHAKR